MEWTFFCARSRTVVPHPRRRRRRATGSGSLKGRFLCCMRTTCPEKFPRRPYGAGGVPSFLVRCMVKSQCASFATRGVNLIIVYMHLFGSIGIDAHFDMLLPSCLAVRTHCITYLSIQNKTIYENSVRWVKILSFKINWFLLLCGFLLFFRRLVFSLIIQQIFCFGVVCFFVFHRLFFAKPQLISHSWIWRGN